MKQLITATVDTKTVDYIPIGSTNCMDDTTISLRVTANGNLITYVNPTFELLVKKADGNRIRQVTRIALNGENISIDLEQQVVAFPGTTTCQLVIKDQDRITTCLFYFHVGRTIDREIIQSISNIKVLEDLDDYVVLIFSNLDEYEKRIAAGDAAIRKLNEDMEAAELSREESERLRKELYTQLATSMKNAIDYSVDLSYEIGVEEANRVQAEKDRTAEFNMVKNELSEVKSTVEKTNSDIAGAEAERVNEFSNIKHDNATMKDKLEKTNTNVVAAERDRLTEFNRIKQENTTLKEALTTINNTANSNEEVRKKQEAARVVAETTRVEEFEKIKEDNNSLNTNLTKKVNDKIIEIEGQNTTFKEEISEQYEHIGTKVDTFINTSDELGASLVDKINQATSKNNELKNSLEETKKYINSLDDSQNIPKLALEVNELKDSVISQDVAVESNESTILEGASNSVSDFTLFGTYEKLSTGELVGVENARIGVKGGKNLWDMKGRLDQKYDYNLIKETLDNAQAESTIPYYNEKGELVNGRSAVSEAWGQKIRVKPNTDYIICRKMISAGHGIQTHIYGKNSKIIMYGSSNVVAVHKFNTKDNDEIIIGFCNGHGSDTVLYLATIRDVALYEYDGTTTDTSYVYEDSKRNEFTLREKIPEYFEDYPLFPLCKTVNDFKSDFILNNKLNKSVFKYKITGDEVLDMGIYSRVGEQLQLGVKVPFIQPKDELYAGVGQKGAIVTNKNLYSYTNQVDMRDRFLSCGDGVSAIYGYNKAHLVQFGLNYKTLGVSEEDFNANKTTVFLEKFREWLKKEQIEVIFSLITPIEVPLNNISTFYIYENSEMFIEDVEGIAPTLSFYYKKSIKGAIDSLVAEVEKIKKNLVEHSDYMVDNDFRITMLELGL